MKELVENRYLKLADETEKVKFQHNPQLKALQDRFHLMFPYVSPEDTVSMEQLSREELPALWDSMETEMQSRGAKFNTLCPIRAEVHRKLLDELLRQISLENPNQGELLWRIRAEAELSVETWKDLCAQGQDYGTRVYRNIDPNAQTKFIQTCKAIQHEIDLLERQLIALKARYNFAMSLRDEQIGVEGEEMKQLSEFEAERKHQLQDLLHFMQGYEMSDDKKESLTPRRLKDLGIENEKLGLCQRQQTDVSRNTDSRPVLKQERSNLNKAS